MTTKRVKIYHNHKGPVTTRSINLPVVQLSHNKAEMVVAIASFANIPIMALIAYQV
jgi:hypothetical protein